MKKLGFTLLMVLGFIFSYQNLQAQENNQSEESSQVIQTNRPGFIDNNGDGICDHYDGKRPGQGLGPGNGLGQGRNNGKGLNRNSGNRSFNGNGNGIRNGSGKGNYGRRFGSANYVDANNNGICDRIENGAILQPAGNTNKEGN